MSYEGKSVYLCTNGHLIERDAYDDPHDCPHCKQPLKHLFGVDYTNGADETGKCPGEENYKKLVKIEEAKEELCTCCGQLKVMGSARWKWLG